MKRLRWVISIAAVAASLGGCVGDGLFEASVSGSIVGADERPLGPGLVLVEKGKVHQGAYQFGALIGDNGRFTVELSSGETWGLHLFHNDYTYLPLEITIDDRQQVVLTSMQVAWGAWWDITGQPTWPAQPSDSTLIRMPWDDNFADNPVLGDITISYISGELMEITVEVNDPDGDLSRMILGYDVATGAGFALNPPEPPVDGNYPNGVYTTLVFIDERHEFGVSPFYFVVSDNLCNNSPITKVIMPSR